MRPYLIAVFALSALLLSGLPGPAGAEPIAGPGAFALLQEDREAGRVDLESYLLQSFRLAFAPDRVDSRYASAEWDMPPCFTPIVTDYVVAKEGLSAEAVREIDGFLTPRLLTTYLSPSGLFELNYDVSGENAVPLDDVDPANGIPDYVERCAEYFDESWNVEITTLGFFAPALPPDDTYDVYFVALSPGLFGYTEGNPGGTSEITIDNNFSGAGHVPSDDPDGAPLGRAKGVISHEFKHASQWTNSGIAGGEWKELDANWVVDVVFDTSNIYLAWCNSLGYNSNLTAPWVRLDDVNGGGSYEDLLWQTYLSETYGNQIIVELWDIIRENPGQNVKGSYAEAMAPYGTDWNDAYPGYMEWSWFTGSRAQPPFGFEEATSLLRMKLRQSSVSSYPFSTSDNVDQLASHPRRFNPGDATGFPRVVFDGDDAHAQFTVSVIAKEPDGTFTIVRPELDENRDLDYVVPMPWSALSYTGVLVTNSKRTGGEVAYSLQVIDEPATDVPSVGAGRHDRVALAPAAPNPFASSTRFEVSSPVSGRGSVRIYDVSGRVVRRLLEGALEQGTAEIVWDGRDDDGARVPAGVYWYRVEAPGGSVARRVTALR